MREGYKFDGWFTAASGGSKVIDVDGKIQASVSGWTNASKNFIITANKTLYAQFTACGKGTYNEGDKPSCTKCAAGKYQNETGKTSCKSCPDGYPNSAEGADAQTKCYKNNSCSTSTCSESGCNCWVSSASGTYSYTDTCSTHCTLETCSKSGCSCPEECAGDGYSGSCSCGDAQSLETVTCRGYNDCESYCRGEYGTHQYGGYLSFKTCCRTAPKAHGSYSYSCSKTGNCTTDNCTSYSSCTCGWSASGTYKVYSPN